MSILPHNHSLSSACEECGFFLFNLITILPSSQVGLYNDARFPGRCILSFKKHYDHMEDMTVEDLTAFMDDVTVTMKAIKHATGVERVNFAVLGNTVSHVHAHLIPRYPQTELLPHKSPWDDPRPRNSLEERQVADYIQRIADSITKFQS